MRRALFLAVLWMAACSPAPQQPLRKEGARFVSLNPCTDALLAELADRDQIAALSAYSSDLAQSSMDVGKARSFPAVQGTMEEVAALRPSLILSGTFTPPATKAAAARLGLAMEEFGMASTVIESEAQVRRMARIVGHAERGEALVARMEAALRGAQWQGAPATALIWQGGGLVAGPHTLISDLASRTGFLPVSAARGLTQAQYLPLEKVVADPPQVILAVSHGTGGHEDRSLSHPVLARLQAVRRFSLEPSLEYCGGPTIIRAAERLAAIRREVALPLVTPKPLVQREHAR